MKEAAATSVIHNTPELKSQPSNHSIGNDGPSFVDEMNGQHANGERMDKGLQKIHHGSSENGLSMQEEKLVITVLTKEDADREEKAATKMQAFIRGYQVRQLFGKIYARNVEISVLGFKAALAEFQRLDFGCRGLIASVTFLLLIIFFIWSVFALTTPTAFDMEESLRKAFDTLRWGPYNEYTYSDVRDASGVGDLVEAAIWHLYSPDPLYELSPECVFKGCTYPGITRDFLKNNCSHFTGRGGYITPQNQVLYGLMVSQTRFEESICNAETFYELLLQDKRHNLTETQLDGLHNASRSCMEPARSLQVNYTSQLRNFAPERFENVEFLTIPTRWDPFVQLSDGTFSVLFGLGMLNMEPDYIVCDVRKLFDDLQWADRATQEICLQVFAENRNGIDNHFVFHKLCVTFDIGGRNLVRRTSGTATVKSFDESTAGLVLSVFVFLGTLVCTLNLIHWFYRCLFDHSFKERYILPRAVTELVFQALAYNVVCYYWILLNRTRLKYDIDGVGTKLPPGEEIVTPEYDVLTQLVDTSSVLSRTASILLLILPYKLIGRLDFHPDLSVLSSTLKKASQDLFIWLIVFLSVLCVFAFSGFLIFGHRDSSFKSFWFALHSVTLGATGVKEKVNKASVINGLNEDTAVVQVYYWTFVFLVAILLMSLLTSIMVGSFVAWRNEVKSSGRRLGVLDTLELSFYGTVYDIKNTLFFSCLSRRGPKYHPLTQHVLNHNGRLTGLSEEKVNKLIFAKPHTLYQVLEWLRRNNTHPLKTHVVRAGLAKIYSQGLANEMLAVMRSKTGAMKTSALKRKVKLVYGHDVTYLVHQMDKLQTKLLEIQHDVNVVRQRTSSLRHADK